MSLYKQKFNPVSGSFNLVSTGTIITFKDGVATLSALPVSGNTLNDARITADTGHLYVWDGTSWVDQGDIIDLKWSAIDGKPTSPVNDIDNAVTNSHAPHSDDQDLSGKVDKVVGSSLVPDTEIAKIHALHADDQDLSLYLKKSEVDNKTIKLNSNVADPTTRLLLHFNNNVTDVLGHTVTNNGCTFSTPGKLGTHAVEFNGVDSYIHIPDNESLGAGDFTIDFWVKSENFIPNMRLLHNAAGNPIDWGHLYVGFVGKSVRLIFSGWQGGLITIGQLIESEWNHVAIVRYNGVIKVYINGLWTSTDYAPYSGDFFSPSTYIAHPGTPSEVFNGSLDEFRISKGTARWISNFVPPTSEYTLVFDDNISVILDTDPTLAANSDTIVASQKAIKEYVDTHSSGGGLSIIQDDTASLDPDETKIITHASDPLYKRVVEILIQLQDLLTFNFNTSTEPNYDYDADKVVFLPIGSDGVSLVPSYGATGMLAYYLFNNDVTDSLDSHDGTNHGVTYDVGIVENKGVFNGASYIDVPNSSDFVPGASDSFAVEFWMNNNPPDGEIISLWNEADNRRSWRLYITSNKLKMDISEDGITVAGTWDLTNTLNTYYNDMHIGLMRNPADNTEIKMFINGSGWLPHSYPGAGAAYNNTIDPIRIGAKGGATPTNFFTGWLAELAIYKNFNFDQYVGMYSNVFQSHIALNSIGQHLSQYDTAMQNVKTNSSGQIDTSDWLGIKGMSFGGDLYGNFQATILFSVDGRTTWKKWNGSSWETALETDEGRNVASLPLTRAEWDLLFVPGTLDYILQLKTNDPSGTPLIYFFVATVYKLGYMSAGQKISFSCLSDTETQIHNDTNIQGPPESFNDVKTNIVL